MAEALDPLPVVAEPAPEPPLVQPPPTLLRQEGEAKTEPAKEPMPGAPETRIFLFRALKAGSTALEFQSRRSFEKETPAVDVFRVQVLISD